MTYIVTHNQCHENILLILDKKTLPKAKLHKHHSHCFTLHKVSKETMIACTCITSSVLRSCSHRMVLPCKKTPRTILKKHDHESAHFRTCKHRASRRYDNSFFFLQRCFCHLCPRMSMRLPTQTAQVPPCNRRLTQDRCVEHTHASLRRRASRPCAPRAKHKRSLPQARLPDTRVAP